MLYEYERTGVAYIIADYVVIFIEIGVRHELMIYIHDVD